MFDLHSKYSFGEFARNSILLSVAGVFLLLGAAEMTAEQKGKEFAVTCVGEVKNRSNLSNACAIFQQEMAKVFPDQTIILSESADQHTYVLEIAGLDSHAISARILLGTSEVVGWDGMAVADRKLGNDTITGFLKSMVEKIPNGRK